MRDDLELSAMRRKAGAGRPPPEIGRATAATALRVAVAQAAEDVAALVALAAGVQEDRVVRDSFIQALPEHALLALCEGEGERYGMVVMDPQTLAALIEIQTTGRVVPHKAEPRAPTRTDAILSADFINRVLELFAELAAEAALPVLPTIKGFRYVLPLEDARAVEMTLEDIPYRQYTLTMDLGSGAKEGQLHLLFPFDPPRPAVSATANIDGGTVGEAVMEAHAEIHAVLHRLELPLTEVADLVPGALVPVPRAALSRVTLEGMTGKEVCKGGLGQVAGHRAVRLSAEVPDSIAAKVGADMPVPPPPTLPGAATNEPPAPPAMPVAGLSDVPPGLGDLPGEGAPSPHDGERELPPLDVAPISMSDLPEPVG
ncbi:FliM/FliN family flagellar motor switch protein [Aliiroseovarius sp.]|uniref:FliM/FliN family flagellar motor switch protein n=1 Tax=Aliiroseovarius sp. TaxID=1872442 RepID=UPI00260DE69D|nr:FliM/FliN family flagellar motor switch protein [Aliiroseovarius sp.]